MSQLLWMINLIPDWFWTLVLWAGVLAVVASYILGKIPFVSQYKIPLRVGGVVATLVGVYFCGVIANEAKWQARVEELQRQVKEAEVEGETANQKLGQALDEKKQIAQEKNKEVIRYVDRWRTKEVLKEIPGPERIKEITKDMSAEQKKAYEAEIEKLKQERGRTEEVIRYIETCPVPKEMLDIHNQGAAKPGKGDKK